MRKETRPSPAPPPSARRASPSTVGRGRAVQSAPPPAIPEYRDELITAVFGDSLSHYGAWARAAPAPSAIISDGGYGVLGFDGDESDHLGLPAWYEPHVAA